MDDALAPTRTTWHRVAEHVLAAGQFAAAGTVRLAVGPAGFRTTAGVDGRQLAVVRGTLVVEDDAGRRSTPLTTLREVAAFAGVEPGLRGGYSPATDPDPDAPLVVDELAATDLATWFALGDTALRRFAPGVEPVLWPEHFDVGVTVDGVNYGASTGDAYLPEPYLYVGPHVLPPRDEFWSQPFGAALTQRRGGPDVAAAVAFFEEGRRRAT